MKARRFDYERPATLDDALALLAGSPDAKVIAGGQSLGPLLNLRLASPALLVDVRGLDELTAARDEGDTVVLGACITHAQIEDGRTIDPTRGLLPRVARGIAYRAVRNRGTLGGSLAHADPAADWLSVMTLLGAILELRSRKSRRQIRVDQFVDGPLSTRLAADEIIVGVRLRKLSPRARTSYYKFNRKPGEFAIAIAGAVDDPELKLRRAVIGATESAPHLIADASALIAGFDESSAHASVAAAGLAAGTYEHQTHFVALKRAVAHLQ
jgi:aerobic carbon-monoxide dehydrogenase medium subunit